MTDVLPLGSGVETSDDQMVLLKTKKRQMKRKSELHKDWKKRLISLLSTILNWNEDRTNEQNIHLIKWEIMTKVVEFVCVCVCVCMGMEGVGGAG